MSATAQAIPVTSAASARKTIVVNSPNNGEKLGEVPAFSVEEARDMIAKARAAQPGWEEAGFEVRCQLMHRFADVLIERMDEVADLISRENGKTLQEAFTTEIIPVINLTRYFAKNARKILKPKGIFLHTVMNRKSYIHYRPRGVVFVISPWNFPFSIPTGEIVMALLAGNTVVQKPASLTPLIAMKCRELMDAAGVPADVFQICTTSGAIASEMIEMGVNYVNFTGSTGVGQRVAQVCGKLLIPCSMELGGKDPALVLADADVELASNAVVWGAFANSGQVCASVERVYVHESLYEPLVQKVVEKTKRLRQNVPNTHDTDVGAMTDPGQLKIVAEQVEDARKRGAKILTGGQKPDRPGNFYPPTVITDVDDSFEVVREESFGPVLPIMKVKDDAEAIRRANDSIYGLNAYVFSKDREHARKVAEKVEAGTVMINEVLFTHAAPETPWGGVKQSGVGRVHGDDGLRSLCEAYHVNEERLKQPADHPLGVWYPYSAKKVATLKRITRLMFSRGIGNKISGLLGGR